METRQSYAEIMKNLCEAQVPQVFCKVLPLGAMKLLALFSTGREGRPCDPVESTLPEDAPCA